MADISALKGYEKSIVGSQELQLLGMLTSEVTCHIESDHLKSAELKGAFEFNPTYRAYSDMFKTLTFSLGSSKVLPKLFKLKKIIYKHIAIEHNFSIIVLLVPKGFEFSLHNHPEMLVLTRMISGEITIESMDKGAQVQTTNQAKPILLVDNNLRKTSTCSSSSQKECENTTGHNHSIDSLQTSQNVPQTCPTKFQPKTYFVENWKQKTLRAGQTSSVFPNTGNIHRIIASQDSIFIDILMPDYRDEANVQFYECVQKSEGMPALIKTIPEPLEQNELYSLDELISDYH